jgi:hypothetical protein
MTAAKENGPSRGKLGPKSGRNNAGGAGMTPNIGSRSANPTKFGFSGPVHFREFIQTE